jgi:hypothetical protein
MHSLFEPATHWAWWIWFCGGWAGGFLLSSWVLSWHAEASDREKQRLNTLVAELRDECRKLRKIAESLR